MTDPYVLNKNKNKLPIYNVNRQKITKDFNTMGSLRIVDCKNQTLELGDFIMYKSKVAYSPNTITRIIEVKEEVSQRHILVFRSSTGKVYFPWELDPFDGLYGNTIIKLDQIAVDYFIDTVFATRGLDFD